jgi:hypothetical protein
MSESQIVEAYRGAAAEYGLSVDRSDHKSANRWHDVVAGAYRELRHRGPAAQRELLVLLGDPNPQVQAWCAAHALEFAPDLGEPVLSALVTGPNRMLGFEAETTLREWREGKLRFP